MRTWSKADVLSIFLVISGIIFLIFCSSELLSVICFLLSSAILLHCVYNTKYDLVKCRDILCRYHSILQSSKSAWIAWNENNEYIGCSKRFRVMFELKGAKSVSISDLVTCFDKKDADELIFQFNKLKRSSINQFSITAVLPGLGTKIEINGSKASINRVSTIIFWCTDVTYISTLVSQLENKLFVYEEAADSLNEILNMLPIPVWKRDENLKISYCNKAYSKALNIPEDKIIKNNIPLIPGTLFGQGHSLAENARKSSRDQSISQYIIINGIKKKFDVHENHAARGALIGYGIDITSEDTLASNLDNIIASNYEVLENVSSAVAIFGKNMRLDFFNTAYQKLMKLEASWLHSKPTYAEILDERRNNRLLPELADYQEFKKTQLEMFNTLQAPIKDLMHLPNGKTLSVITAPYPLGGLLYVFEDVSDSLNLQRKNNTLLAVYKETIDHLHEGIAVYGSDNRLKIVNNSMMKSLGINDRTQQEMKGMHISEMLTYAKEKIDYGDDWDVFKVQAVSNLTDRKTKSGKTELKDGTVVMFSYIPLPDGAHMISYTDITDTCVVEKAIKEKDQAVREANRSRYEFVSSISVELREPINSVIGFSELLSREYYGKLNDKQREYCYYITSSANQLYQLTNNMLEMALVDVESVDLEVASFVVSDAISEVVETVRKSSQEKGVSLITDFENKSLEYEGDRKRIKQCLFSIMTNAVQISPINRQLSVRTVSDDSNLRIIIKDEGNIGETGRYKRGSRSFLSRLSEYNTASMSMVKSLLEMHGGDLSIKTDSNGCSSVICRLPIVKHDADDKNKQDSEICDINETLKSKKINEDIPKVANA